MPSKKISQGSLVITRNPSSVHLSWTLCSASSNSFSFCDRPPAKRFEGLENATSLAELASTLGPFPRVGHRGEYVQAG